MLAQAFILYKTLFEDMKQLLVTNMQKYKKLGHILFHSTVCRRLGLHTMPYKFINAHFSLFT